MDQPSPQEATKPGFFNNDIVQQQSIAKATEASLKRLSEAKTDDVKGIAASQIELLSEFYKLSLSQAGRSFRWALIASVIGLLFLMAAMAFQFSDLSGMETVVALIGGGLIEFIAAVNFYLYGKTLEQLNLFQGRLEVTQRFLVANSLCESLGEDYKDKTRAALISQLARNEAYDAFMAEDEPGPRHHRGRRASRDRNRVAEEERHPAAAQT